MKAPDSTNTSHAPARGLFWLVTCAFAAVAVFFLWEEHRAHFLGALPYVLLLLCPALHLLMHRGHRHNDHAHDARATSGEKP